MPKATDAHQRKWESADKYKEGKSISVIPPPSNSLCISILPNMYFIQTHIFLNNDGTMLYITLSGAAFSLNDHGYHSMPINTHLYLFMNDLPLQRNTIIYLSNSYCWKCSVDDFCFLLGPFQQYFYEWVERYNESPHPPVSCINRSENDTRHPDHSPSLSLRFSLNLGSSLEDGQGEQVGKARIRAFQEGLLLLVSRMNTLI